MQMIAKAEIADAGISALKDQRVLITGANGFVGSCVVERLAQAGVECVAMVRPQRSKSVSIDGQIKIREATLSDDAAIERAVDGCDIVINCAAATSRSTTSLRCFSQANIDGVARLIKAAAKANVRRVVHCSTSGVHGILRRLPTRESDPLRSKGIYSRSKLKGEQVAGSVAAELGVQLTIARLTTTCGRRASGWTQLCRDIHAGGAVSMAGNGDHPFHMSHVDDVVDGLVLCATHPAAAGEVFFIGSDPIPTLRSFLETIAAELGTSLRARRYPAAPLKAVHGIFQHVLSPLSIEHRIMHSLEFFLYPRAYSIEKAQSMLGFAPTRTLTEAVHDMIDWMKMEKLIAHHDGAAE